MRDPVGGREVGSQPLRARQQADRQVCPGALQVERVEAAIRHPVGAGDDDLHPLPPRLDRILGVQPEHVRDLLPELVERRLRLELRVNALGPADVRAGPRGPVRRPLVHDSRDRGDVRERVTACSRRVDAVEDPGARPGQRHPRGSFVRKPFHPLFEPRRDVVQRLVVRELQPCPLDELVPPEDVDVLRASLVGRAGDSTRRVLHPEVGGNSEDLTRLQVRAEADEEVGQAVYVCGVVAHRAGTLHRSCG